MLTRKETMKLAQHAEILKLRHDGYNIEEIAAKIGISPIKCHVLLDDAITELQGDSTKHAAAIREVELLRLDTATKALMPGVEDGSYGAINTLLKVQDRRARLLGLDGPIKTDATITVDIPWLSQERLAYKHQSPALRPPTEPDMEIIQDVALKDHALVEPIDGTSTVLPPTMPSGQWKEQPPEITGVNSLIHSLKDSK